jgi:hypothetical protein
MPANIKQIRIVAMNIEIINNQSGNLKLDFESFTQKAIR